MAELWDGRNADGSLSGVMLVRGGPIPAGQYHLVCEVLVRHADGGYLLMQRDPRKEAYPGWYEASAGGSALCGEDADACIRRELREETGIAWTDFQEIARTVREEDSCIFYSYICTVDWPKDRISLQEGETEGFDWLSEAAFVDLLNSGRMIPEQMDRYGTYYRQKGYLTNEARTR